MQKMLYSVEMWMQQTQTKSQIKTNVSVYLSLPYRHFDLDNTSKVSWLCLVQLWHDHSDNLISMSWMQVWMSSQN